MIQSRRFSASSVTRSGRAGTWNCTGCCCGCASKPSRPSASASAGIARAAPPAGFRSTFCGLASNGKGIGPAPGSGLLASGMPWPPGGSMKPPSGK
jgi:hypothetical protein